jgi:organic radical activating enzyme
MRYPAHFPDDHPDDPRIYVPNIEFYITNVCNLACPQCNRFNDHAFTGYQKWSDYEAEYTDWATKIRLQRVTILGGEPLLNPTICDWITGINRLWGKRIQILTNGTHINRVPGLYDALNNYRESMFKAKNWIGVSVHNANDLERHFEEGKKFLKGENIQFLTKEQTRNGSDYAFVDDNGVEVHYWLQDNFHKSAVQKDDQGKFTLHQSVPEEAHNNCGFVEYQCHHFIKAKLYKCGPVALFPEFDDQHKFNISDEDRKILHSYHPLSVDEFAQRGQQFIDNIDNVIDQCKFCPSKRTENQIIESLSKAKNATSSFNPRR